MRFVLALLVLALVAVGPAAVLGTLVLPRLLEAERLLEGAEEAGVVAQLRRRVAQEMVDRAREETGAPVRRTSEVQAEVDRVLDDAWMAGLAERAAVAARTALAEDRGTMVRAEAPSLEEHWPGILAALLRSLPVCGEGEEPPGCRPPGMTAEQLPVPPPRLSPLEVPILHQDGLRQVLSLSYRQRVPLAVGGTALLGGLAAGGLPWLGRGLMAASLVPVLVGLILLGAGPVLGDEGAPVRLLALTYGPVLLGSAVTLGAGAWMAFSRVR